MDAYLMHMLDQALRQQNDAIVLAMLCPGCHNVCQLRGHKRICECFEGGVMIQKTLTSCMLLASF